MMKKKSLLLRFAVLVTAMMCALGIHAQEAYACFTLADSTLTFYYDTQRSSRPGTTYDLNWSANNPGWYIDDTRSSVTRVVFDSSFADARPTSTSSWFKSMTNLTSIIGLGYLNTSNVTTMSNMFYDCSGLTSLDLSNFNTANVIFMTYMFRGCSGLTSLNLSGFNTANVTYMSNMFNGCSGLTSLDLSSFSTANVTNMSNMFNGCSGLTSLDLGSFNTANVTTMYGMFAACSGLTSLDLSNFNTANVTIMTYMFYNCSGLTSLDLSHFNTANVTNMGSMFYKCSGLTSLDVSNFNTAEVTDMDNMFSGCSVLTSLDVSHFNTANVIKMNHMFAGCGALTSLDVTHFNTANVTGMRAMFSGCDVLTSLDVTHFNTANVTNMNSMFNFCRGLTALDLSGFNTANVTDMNNMFNGCRGLRTIYAGDEWSTEAVTSSLEMFVNCTNLVGGQGTTYDADHMGVEYAHIDGGPSNPGYFTEKPTEAYAVYTEDNTTLTFYYDNKRTRRPGTTYDLNTGNNKPGWYVDDTRANVTHVVFDPSFADARPTTTYYWFNQMRNLQSVTGMSYLNTSEVTRMDLMFSYCSILTSLDVSHFNTEKVTKMPAMFYGSVNLTSLDLSSFNTSKVTSMDYMFDYCYSLQTIYVGNGWSTAAVTISTDMFYNCTSLVGGQGTTWNSSNPTDKTYAHIDGGPSNPGYFTEKGPEAYACYTVSNTTLTFYYDNQRSSRPGTTYGLNTGTEEMEWHDTPYFFTHVVFDPSFAAARPTTTYRWFSDMSNLVSITGMEYLNTDSVTNMAYMFMACRNLSSLDLSHFNTANVTTMECMFESCKGLMNLDLSSFNTDNVTTMECMFDYCVGLTSVDLSSFTNTRVTRTSNMFEGCSALTTIYASSSWSLPANNDSWAMFMDCTSLVGGMGTTYDEDHVDAAYAHIDGGPSNPGYFTEKPAFKRGDVNGDGDVDINDVTALIGYVLTGNSTGLNLAAANVNGDTDVDINDVTALIGFVLTGTW